MNIEDKVLLNIDQLVIGTAGHVDHGKTELVKALTGYDTDRLREEKERGMTIELGFAPFTLHDKTVSIVDVPGHEKLVKTMVSGASGMDMALLIIAADEGIMPQTVEHLHILTLLDIKSLIVVVTKSDLVEMGQLTTTLDAIKTHLQDTPYSKAPIQCVDSLSGTGISELKSRILYEADGRTKKGYHELFRMPIDRVFSIKGYGTVITGTILGGKINEGDLVHIMSQKGILNTKVKNLQIHGNAVTKATEGQRCAINLNKVETSQIERGHVLVKPDTIRPTSKLDAVLYPIHDQPILTHNHRVRINIGTTEVIGKLRIVGADSIGSGQKGYASISLEKPVIATRQDRFIIRSLTPVTTIGGGVVINHCSMNYPRLREETLRYFHLFEEGDLSVIIDYTLSHLPDIYDIDLIYHKLYCNKQAIWQGLKQLIQDSRVVKLNPRYYISRDVLDDYTNILINRFHSYYHNTYHIYMNKEALKTGSFPKLDAQAFQGLVELWIKEKRLSQKGPLLAMDVDERTLMLLQDSKVQEIEGAIMNSGMMCTQMEELVELGYASTDILSIVSLLESLEHIKKVSPNLLLHISSYHKLLNIIRNMDSHDMPLTVIAIRDALGIGRKRTIQLLEFLDEERITRRVGNYRVLC